MSGLSRTRNPQRPPAGGGWSSRLIREPDFWRLWCIGLVMFVVRWIDTIAAAIFTYQVTESAFLVAFVTMLRMLPMALFGLLFGSLADRFERRSSLIFIVMMSLVASVILSLLGYFGHLAVWHLAVASFINGLAWAADNPVRRMMIGDVAGVEKAPTALSVDSGSNIASRIAGPTLGGVLYAFVGIYGTFALDSVLYSISLWAALGLTYRNRPNSSVRSSVIANVMEGLKLLGSNEHLRGVLIITLIFNLFAWPFTSMIAVIGKDNLLLDADGVGLLAAAEGVGATLSAILITIFALPRHFARIYVGGTFVYLIAMCAVVLVREPLLAGSLIMIVGFGGGGFATLQATLVYVVVSQEMRGRALGVLVTFIGVGPLGFILIGALAERLGASYATVVMAILGLGSTLLTRRYWREIGRSEALADPKT